MALAGGLGEVLAQVKPDLSLALAFAGERQQLAGSRAGGPGDVSDVVTLAVRLELPGIEPLSLDRCAAVAGSFARRLNRRAAGVRGGRNPGLLRYIDHERFLEEAEWKAGGDPEAAEGQGPSGLWGDQVGPALGLAAPDQRELRAAGKARLGHQHAERGPALLVAQQQRHQAG